MRVRRKYGTTGSIIDINDRPAREPKVSKQLRRAWAAESARENIHDRLAARRAALGIGTKRG